MQTGELVSQVEFGLQTEQVALLVRYLDAGQNPAADRFAARWDELLTGFEVVGDYSLRLVEIAEDDEDADSKKLLATSVAEMYAGFRSIPSLEQSLATVDLETILVEIRTADKFISAAQAAHKAVAPAVDALNALTLSTSESLDAAYDKLLADINTYHADSIRYRSTVDAARADVFRNLTLLDLAYRNEDQQAWDALRSDDRELQLTLQSMNRPTIEAVSKAQQVLTRQLGNLDVLRTSLNPDLKLYQDELLELRTVGQSADSAMLVARLTINSWDRGHQMFVTGKKTGFALVTSALTTYAIDKGRRTLY